MDNMEEKIGAILGNPQMMQQIMDMAQALGGQPPEPEPQKQEIPQPVFQPSDLALVQTLSGIARQSGIDKREQALLGALRGYLTGDRISRLERAMRAAKMAKMATSVMGQQGLLGGR